MRIVWLSDIHLNFADVIILDEFLNSVAAEQAEAIILTGDIAESHNLVSCLRVLDDAWQTNIFFVLGNHDFYHGSIVKTRSTVSTLCDQSSRLHYLTNSQPIELAPGLGLVGHDGWADARFGDYERSEVMLNDYRLIEELSAFEKAERLPRLRALGDEAGQFVRQSLTTAVQRFDAVYVATHVPPLREACWHEGQISDDEWAPHFTCKAVGDAVLDVMRESA